MLWGIFPVEVFVVVQSLSHIWLFETPWTAVHQASLSSTFSSSSNSCPLSQWWYLTILSSVALFSFCLELSQNQGVFQRVSSWHQVVKYWSFSFSWILRVDFFQDWLIWSLCRPRDSQECSPASQFKSISSLGFSLLYGPTLIPIHAYWKNHNFDYLNLCLQSRGYFHAILYFLIIIHDAMLSLENCKQEYMNWE